MWKENKTSTIESAKELIPWVNIKEERAIFDAKIMASNELKEEEKILFINDLSKIPDNKFKEAHNYITKNYQRVIKWIKVRNGLENIVGAFGGINKSLEEINELLIKQNIKSWQLIREKQDKLSQKEKLSAEASMDNFIA